MRGFLFRALQGVAVGALIGSVTGMVRAVMTITANLYLEYGLNHLAAKVLLSEVLRFTAWGALVVAAAIAVGLVAYPIARILRRSWPRALGGAMAAPIILVLFVAVGYYINRHYLSGLLEWTSILGNIGMAVVALVLWYALAHVFDQVVAAPGPAGALRKTSLIAVPVVLLSLIAGQIGLWLFSPSPMNDSRPNVLIIMVDALRHDRVGVYGYSRSTTPNIDQLASHGMVFTQAVAQASWTKPSVASLFSAMYPRQHNIASSDWIRTTQAGEITVDVLNPKVLTLAELLSNAGYDTVAIGENNHLTPKTGFDQGFDSYQMHIDPDEHWTRAPEMNRRFLHWMNKHAGNDFFAYLHYIDVHWPYRSPPPYKGMYAGPAPETDYNRLGFFTDHNAAPPFYFHPAVLKHMSDAYDEGIRFIDDKIGEVLNELKRRDLYDDILIVLVADHGDEFLEHGKFGHGHSLYDELVRVPLIIKFPCPGPHCGSKRVDKQVEVIDIMSTILHSAGISMPAGLFGRDLTSDDPEPESAAFSEMQGRVSLRTPTHKFIYSLHADDEELYDLTTDPGEKHNQASEKPALATEFRRRVLDWIAIVDQGLSVKSGEVKLDEESKKRLEALGYVE